MDDLQNALAPFGKKMLIFRAEIVQVFFFFFFWNLSQQRVWVNPWVNPKNLNLKRNGDTIWCTSAPPPLYTKLSKVLVVNKNSGHVPSHYCTFYIVINHGNRSCNTNSYRFLPLIFSMEIVCTYYILYVRYLSSMIRGCTLLFSKWECTIWEQNSIHLEHCEMAKQVIRCTTTYSTFCLRHILNYP